MKLFNEKEVADKACRIITAHSTIDKLYLLSVHAHDDKWYILVSNKDSNRPLTEKEYNLITEKTMFKLYDLKVETGLSEATFLSESTLEPSFRFFRD